MYLVEKTEVTDISALDKKALVQLDGEIYNLLQMARKGQKVLFALEETYFGADEIEQGSFDAIELCGYYPEIKLHLQMAIDYVGVLHEHLEALDKLAEKYSKSNRKDGSDDE